MLRSFILFSYLLVQAYAALVDGFSFHTYLLGYIKPTDILEQKTYLGSMYGNICNPDVNKLINYTYSLYNGQDNVKIDKNDLNVAVPKSFYNGSNCFIAFITNLRNDKCFC